ncbi:PDZ domain-containing protein [Streptomyces griseofuscus]|uniref:PDZ domain-containing protein n=1 Tax=Streptomyces griseofuscus TaxID=146922 RepID=UPI0012B9642C
MRKGNEGLPLRAATRSGRGPGARVVPRAGEPPAHSVVAGAGTTWPPTVRRLRQVPVRAARVRPGGPSTECARPPGAVFIAEPPVGAARLRGHVRRVLRAGPCRRSGAGRGDHPGAAHPVRTGSPAQAGGLRAGDRMFAVDGNLVPDARVAVAALRSRRPGSTVVLTVGRGNGRLHLSVRPATGLPRSAPR